jgi:hypothetical protein
MNPSFVSPESLWTDDRQSGSHTFCLSYTQMAIVEFSASDSGTIPLMLAYKGVENYASTD